MTREEAIQWLKAINTKEFGWDEFALQESQREIRERCEQGVREAIDMAIEALKAEPNKAVPPSLADVYKWERDIALSQLEEYGICFGEKKRDDLVSVVRCKDCRHYGVGNCYMYGGQMNEDDFCSYGERRK